MTNDERTGLFDQWLDRHVGLLFKVVRLYAPDPPDRDDLFQEIAVQIWNAAPSFRGESAVSTFIYRIALRTAVRWSAGERKREARNRPLLHDAEPAASQAATDPRLDWLYAEIARLDEIDRSIALMLLDGLTHCEMAGVLGVAEGTVSSRIHRIKKRLVERSSACPAVDSAAESLTGVPS